MHTPAYYIPLGTGVFLSNTAPHADVALEFRSVLETSHIDYSMSVARTPAPKFDAP